MILATLRALAVGAVAAVLVVGLGLLGRLERSELAVLSGLFELRGERSPASPIVIVAIDEDSFDELNLSWPFPRALHGQLIDAIRAGRPAVIGFDLILSEPSSRGPADDEAMGTAVARAGNVVLGATVTTVAESFYVKTDLNLPIPVIRHGAAGVGPVDHLLDRDGHLRRARLRHRVGQDAIPSWDVEIYRLARRAGLAAAPLPQTDSVIINFRGGPGTFPWLPYHRVLRGEVPPETFRGAIVLVGATTPVLHDTYSTPFSERQQMPGVEVHAHAIDSLLRGDTIGETPRWTSLGLAAALALLSAWLVAQFRAFRAFAGVLLLAAGLAGATFALFVFRDLWFRVVGPELGLALGFGGAVVQSFVREQREKRRLSQFFSPSVLRAIVRRPGNVDLGSSRRTITVLFSDIRGFTSISEHVTPETVAEMLREYLTEMTEVVFRHGGTVDKYIGDAIMAFWNAPFEDPDHAVRAVEAALDLQERTLAVSARWKERLGVPLRNGVGINTGEAVVGALGSRQRLEYTAIGDTVNLASRLESLTKEHGMPVIIGEATWELVHARFLTRTLGAVHVKGKDQPVRIHAVLPGDLRRHPRTSLALSATVAVTAGGETVTVRAHDVGDGGLGLLDVPMAWGPGTAVEVRCEGGLLPAPLAGRGTIAWRHLDAAGVALADTDRPPADGGPHRSEAERAAPVSGD